MGAAARLVYEGICHFVPSNTLGVLAAAGVGALLYGWLLVVTRAVSEKELRSMPMGRLLLRFMR